MDWIANMPGPQFLGLYAAVIFATLVCAYFAVRSSGRDDSIDPLVSTSPNPYEMAYLRGGELEVAKLMLIELARRGYIQERMGTTLRGGKVYLRQSEDHPSPALLPSTQRQVFDLIGKDEQPLNRLMRSSGFKQAIGSVTAEFKEKLSREGLVVARSTRWKVFFYSALVMLGLGGYKFVVALSKGRHNVGFLVMLSIIALVALAAIVSGRLTSRGSKYFRQTQ